MLPFPADQSRCFEVFNAASIRPAPNDTKIEIGSAAYTHNAATIYEIGKAFDARAKEQAAAFKQHYYVGSALLEKGLAQYACHADDADVVKSILEGMKADGIIADVREIPYKKSQSYAYSKAKFTPH